MTTATTNAELIARARNEIERASRSQFGFSAITARELVDAIEAAEARVRKLQEINELHP
jgi:hypothetical protein